SDLRFSTWTGCATVWRAASPTLTSCCPCPGLSCASRACTGTRSPRRRRDPPSEAAPPLRQGESLSVGLLPAGAPGRHRPDPVLRGPEIKLPLLSRDHGPRPPPVRPRQPRRPLQQAPP